MSPVLFLLLAGALGLLTGAVVFLFRQLVTTKDARIEELETERDYYRTASLLERTMPSELEPHALPPGYTALAVTQPAAKAPEPSKFVYYSLFIQAAISIIVVIGSFVIILAPIEESGANEVAYQLLSFVLGVWLGRGVDYSINKFGK